MAGSKKPLEAFDHNKSDSDDTDFNPTEARPKRSSKKARRSGKSSKSSKTGKRKVRYRGSDIEDDDEDVSSEEDLSFDDDEEDEVERDAKGRPMRGSRRRQTNYEENSSSEETNEDDLIEDSESASDVPKRGGRGGRDKRQKVESEDEDDDLVVSPQKTQKDKLVVKLKLAPRTTRASSAAAKSVATPSAGRLRTTSVARSTRSTSHEPLSAGLPATTRRSRKTALEDEDDDEIANPITTTRNSRGMKGLQVAETIKEATQETGSFDQPQADATMEAEITAVNDLDETADKVDEEADVVGDLNEEEQGDDNDRQQPAIDSIENDDASGSDQPVLRRGRTGRNLRQGSNAASEDAGPAASEGKTSTRRSSRRAAASKRKAADQGSDFDPEDAEPSDDEMSDSPRKKRPFNSEDDDEFSSDNRGANRKGRNKSKSASRRRGSSSEEIDPDEVAEEAQELRSNKKRQHHQMSREGIEYEAPSKRQRRNVNYFQAPLAAVFVADEAEAEVEEPAARKARPARTGGTSKWDRTLFSTLGPFGGATGNAPVIQGGPWGTGAVAGVDSDSSDDEGMQQPPANAGGNVGMTPTSAFPPGTLPGMGQTNNIEGIGGAPNVGKIKSQKALADADPLGVDQNVDFSKVGGLDGHIDQLKEMVMMPLLYPELFQKFNVVPPRGVLFHGPPGTGKTLLARALAANVGSSGKKVTFYMRKGADALSKWVGEAERQLRLLFEEARKTQPSIIFFDEIDGLAPVRSSKQEQIHASIVSTLLALMDGMDGRGQVIVIGATNRPDNIDPALRRPGRFDREFYFPLPGVEGRKSIINIHTKGWEIDDSFKVQLAELTKGYGGADLRSLCTEAALNSIQRTYPQIYSSNDKLLLDASKIKVNAKDFMLSIKKIIPSSERSTSSGAAPLPKVVEPLLRAQLAEVKKILDNLIPQKKKTTALEEAMFEQYDDEDLGFAREQMQQEFERSRVFRPRLLICGETGMGQQYLGGAILNHFEGLHVQSFDLPTIYSDSARSPETAIVQLFAEVKRHKPSVIYIPAVDVWYSTLPGNVITTFLGLLKSIPPTDPVMVLGITDVPADKLDPSLMRDLFGFSKHNQYTIQRPSHAKREEFFQPILAYARKCPKDFPEPANRKRRKLEELPFAPVAPPPPPSKAELRALKKRDYMFLNHLKISLQPIMDQAAKKYKKFREPCIPLISLQYLYDEADPNFVRPDIAPSVEFRPYEIDTDKNGVSGLREVATGRFYYNLTTSLIDERLANGYYARPKDFCADLKTFFNDYKNAFETGFREEGFYKQAKELKTNVEVDCQTVEVMPMFADCENVYQRQLQRAREKEKRLEELVKQDSAIAGAADKQATENDLAGPITLDEEVESVTRPLLATPLNTSRGLSNGLASNGTSVPSRTDDTQMTGVEDSGAQSSPMNPPQRSLASGQNTQVSHRSAWQELSHGTSPSQLINDASTTTSGKKSSEAWSQAATNGISDHNLSPTKGPNEHLDTQNTQETSSEEWLHSQAHGLARGLLRNSNPSQTTSSDSQVSQAPAPRFPAPPRIPTLSRPSGFANLLNDVPPPDPTSSQLSSQKDQIVDEKFIADLLRHLVDGSSGCSVEQLEQVYRELMDTLWNSRGEWNRSLVTAKLVQVFNVTIQDIEDTQKVLQASQPLGHDYGIEASQPLGNEYALALNQ